MQVSAYSRLTHGIWPVWDALNLLDTLREYETPLLQSAAAAPVPDSPDSAISLLDHALYAAEACRAAFPDHDWLHLAGLLHSLGKLLAHRRWGIQQRSVCPTCTSVAAATGAALSGAALCHADGTYPAAPLASTNVWENTDCISVASTKPTHTLPAVRLHCPRGELSHKHQCS